MLQQDLNGKRSAKSLDSNGGALPKGSGTAADAFSESSLNQGSEKKSMPRGDGDIGKMLTTTEKRTGNTTGMAASSLPRPETPDDTRKILKSVNGNQGNTMQETKLTSETKSTPVGAEIVPTEDFSQLSSDLRKVSWESMNLLTDSAKHLHKLMLGLLPQSTLDKASEEVQMLDTERVRVAAECAKGITNIVKTQIDGLKALKEFQ